MLTPHTPSSRHLVTQLADTIGIDAKHAKTWFVNRRTKKRKVDAGIITPRTRNPNQASTGVKPVAQAAKKAHVKVKV